MNGLKEFLKLGHLSFYRIVLIFVSLLPLGVFTVSCTINEFNLELSSVSPDEKNYIDSEAKRILGILRLGPQLTSAEKPGEPECRNCNQPTATELKYEQCRGENNYLDDRINNILAGKIPAKDPNSNPIPVSPGLSKLMKALIKPQNNMPQVIRPECVAQFMALFPGGSTSRAKSYYRACDPYLRSTTQTIERPCINNSYVNLVSNSFNLAANCLSYIDPDIINTAAKLYPHESGYHINAMRPKAFDAGVGQLIKISIDDVNQNSLADIRKSLSSWPPDSACRSLNDELFSSNIPFSGVNANSCERLNLEKGNPVTNFIYSLALLKNKKNRLNLITFKNRRFASSFNLPADEMKKIEDFVLTLAYNVGEAVSTPVNAVITRYGSRKITNATEFLTKLKREIYFYTLARLPSAERKCRDSGNYNYCVNKFEQENDRTARSKSGYFDMIQSRFNQVNKNLGDGKTCLPNQ